MFRREFGGGEEGDGAFAEVVVEGSDADGGADGRIGEDDVEGVAGEFGEKAVDLVLVAGESDGFVEFESGFEEGGGDSFGEGVGDADTDVARFAGGPAVDDVDELLSGGEDAVGVGEDAPAVFGEDEIASTAGEEGEAGGFLERADLSADGGLGEP